MQRQRALDEFRRTARRMRPTQQHRPALWENMLGTVYAADAQRDVRYCDYRYNEAVAHVGAHRDVRCWRLSHSISVGGDHIPKGKLVWFVIYGAPGAQEKLT